MDIQPFKDRILDPSLRVRVYRNLTRKGVVWSVKQKGLVVGYTSDLTLSEPKMVINTSGKQRAIREQHRNVHAYIEGLVTDVHVEIKNMHKITYYPFSEKGFVYCENNSDIKNIKLVSFTDTGVYVK